MDGYLGIVPLVRIRTSIISILDEGDVSKSFLRVFIFYKLDVLYYHMHKEFTRNNLNLS